MKEKGACSREGEHRRALDLEERGEKRSWYLLEDGWGKRPFRKKKERKGSRHREIGCKKGLSTGECREEGGDRGTTRNRKSLQSSIIKRSGPPHDKKKGEKKGRVSEGEKKKTNADSQRKRKEGNDEEHIPPTNNKREKELHGPLGRKEGKKRDTELVT